VLDLVAAVAHAAVADPTELVRSPTCMSMPVFNRVKPVVDAARGITDQKDRDRTPSAEAIHLRFNKAAERVARKVSWHDIVAVSLLPDHRMWLSALGRREEEKVPLRVLVHALRYVACQLGTDELRRQDYQRKRDDCVAADRARFGLDGVLARILPTLNQVEGQYKWNEALKASGLRQGSRVLRGASARHPHARPQPPSANRQPRPRRYAIAQAIACYAALNDCWPSRVALRAFARHAELALPDIVDTDWRALCNEADELLRADGLAAPAASRPARSGGRGKRLTFSYPTNGIPGAPALVTKPAPPAAAAADPETQIDRAERMRGRCVLGLRVWLASLTSRDKRTRAAYVEWATRSGWPSADTVSRHGGFAALRLEAEAENARDRRRHGTPLPNDVLARVEKLNAEQAEAEARQRASHRAEPTPSAADDQAPPPTFSEALRAVLAGPRATVEAPRQ